MLDLPYNWKVKQAVRCLVVPGVPAHMSLGNLPPSGSFGRAALLSSTAVEAATVKIGELAKRLELNPRTIRFYEDAGILPPPARTRGGFRLYGQEDEQRLRFVKAAQRLGLTLGEIKEVMAFRDRDQAPCRYVAAVIEQRLAEINERTRELRTLKQELTELRARMRREGVAERDGSYCHYIETAATGGGC